MFDNLKQQWRELKRRPPGERFQSHNREQKKRNKSKARRFLSLGAAIACLAVGVVLVFIPGPAIVFFFIGGGLMASHSMWVARGLDFLEVRLRRGASAAKRWWRAHSWAERAPLLLAAFVGVLGAGLAAFELFTGALSR
jgi:uncharacterized RDD family membrane protein YckC